MLSVRLPEDLETRLNVLASQTNRSKSFYVVEALKRHLDDLEDFYLAEKAHIESVLSGEKTLSIDEVIDNLGL